MEYNFKEIEKKWQDYWAGNKTFATGIDPDKPKYYVLDMFPYPSGAGLHVGHPLGYIASDIMARYMRLKGYNVLHPMGYDSFGLPAEQYAIQTGQHPKITTENNIKRYREQLDKIGFSFDWDREVQTSDPSYYKWTQWIFLKLFNSWYNPETDKAEGIENLVEKIKNGLIPDPSPKEKGGTSWDDLSEKEKSDVLMNYRLAYLSEAWVNWSPQLGTVLANEEVKDGVSERGGYPVERKLMPQWSLRITAYAERLLKDLDGIDWTESIKEAQRNWIGRSEGTSLKFSLIPNPSPKEKGVDYAYKTGDKKYWEQLKERARELRKDQTEAEKIIWEKLRDSQTGHKIRRQHPIGPFVADFICIGNKLIIELDGVIHNFQKERDEARTYFLNDLGYEVIRFSNDDVMKNTDSIVRKIKEILDKKVLSFGEDLGEACIEVFTTRPDTIFGVSFVTLAPEHELVEKITTPERKKAVDEYITYAKNRSERDRQADVKKITGEFTGAYALHPFTGKPVPVWIGDYVLASYGTGAVMAVPAHDERDFAFANTFGLEKPVVIQPPVEWNFEKQSYDEKLGKCINSDFLNGLEIKDAIKKAIEEIEKRDLGKGKTNYRLRDAIFGRQRYWGEPIPIYYKDGIPYGVEEKDLPITLPEVDKFLPTETGEPPLARAKDWFYSPSPSERGLGGEVELTTMPGWAGSSWYYLRYMDAHNEKEFASKEAVNYWNDIDLYIGGAEHATGHLLYVRFWTKFLHDLGLIPVIEPVKKLINQGMIQGVSQYVREIRVDASIKAKYDLVKKKLKIKNGDVLLRELDIPSEMEVQHLHVFCNYNCKLKFEYYLYDKNELLKTDEKVYNHAKIDFVKEVIVNSGTKYVYTLLDKWLKAEPEYNPIVITDFPCLAYWHYEKKEWRDICNNAHINQDTPLWLTRPEAEKMSKSKLNVVSPDDTYYNKGKDDEIKIPGIIEQYGADCLRLYEMFLGPLEQHKPWTTNGITCVSGFLKKLWKLYYTPEWNNTPLLGRGEGGEAISDEAPTKEELKVLHKTIKKITDDIERYSFNTSVSNFMICINELTDLKCNKRAILEPLAIVIAPYAPHIAEELWAKLGHKESITYAEFPVYKEEYLTETSFNYPVSFNGKTRFFHELELSLSKEDIEKEVLALEQTKKYLEGKSPKKIIVVPNKIVNVVI